VVKRRSSDGGGDTWLNTYADMVTLLLTFFVVMLSAASQGSEMYDAVIAALSRTTEVTSSPPSGVYIDPPGLTDEINMESLFKLIETYVVENQKENLINVSERDGVVFVRLNSAMIFEPDRAIMLASARDLMSFVGETLKFYEGRIRNVNVLGHTARTGRISSEINDWRLSGERAAAVATYLEEMSRFDKSKLITFGYADNYPIADNATEEGRRQNRRVELVIVGVESMQSFDVYGLLSGVYNGEDDGDILMPRGVEEVLSRIAP